MKKILFILLILLNSNIFAERIYKEFQIDGKTVSKWVDADVTTYKYDTNGNLINEKYSNGDKSWESWYKYDEKGNKKIHKKTSHGAEYWYEYEAKGNLIDKKFTSASGDNEEEWYEYEYNENDKIVKKTYYKTI